MDCVPVNSLMRSQGSIVAATTTAAAATLLLVGAYYGLHLARVVKRRASLAARAARARQQRDASRDAAEVPPVAPPHAERISTLTATVLATAIRNGSIRAVDAVATAARRSRAIGRMTDCCAEENYVAAISAARDVDIAVTAGRALPPLAGVPISVKDTIDQSGFSSTCGLAARTLQPCTQDSVLLSILRDAGAIPVVRSAAPQALMLPETMSAAWGVAKNPWAMNRTPGGSSGGEGVLLAARATPLGIGSDVGGSIRIPAHFCGVVGFKPTPQRLTRSGMAVPRSKRVNGQEALVSVAGPMARCVDDCELVMRLWLRDESPLWRVDPLTAPVPWRRRRYTDGAREIVRARAVADARADGASVSSAGIAGEGATRTCKLRVGYYVDDGWFAPAPACARAVQDAVDKLRADGVECVEFQPPDVWRVVMCYYALMSSDGQMRSFIDGCEGEALHSYFRKLRAISRMPPWLRGVVARAQALQGHDRVAALIRCTGKKQTYEYWDWVVERKRLQGLWVDAMRRAGVDALIAPGLALPALPHGGSADLTPACSYTLLFNLLHWPAGTVPVTTVRNGETDYRDERVRADEWWHKAAVSACAGSEGLPCGVQVATLPFEDELCLHVMKRVEGVVKFSEKPNFELDDSK